ncbi:MATE family efflux transporter [Murimonas intestini]|uniref:MATE family efflux protein n=1 Tax=Murimonas intestini TaxID=1337051 RepID=A0AB73T9B7_9FIRM|nr:MATE family efflux transporter [Murimonas intestini]MCR1839424.1 MATE family efflux transporter [Murimonas intestini]MCR1864719.1 MATE family efflux transporter [Murimonas intestini]MCR1882329.1 MATE family efflux transporter [Murimonas intestini]
MTKNLTTGQPAKLIVLFTIPLLIGNLFQQFYSMADTLIVGRTIGVNALAAVGCTGSITFFILGFAQGLSSGLSIITAQRFGAQDEEGIRRSAAASIMISLCVTIILTALAIPLTMPLLRMLQTPEEIIGDAYQYLVIIFIGTGACVLFNLLSNLVRALGDSRTPLYFLVIACVLNIGLDFLCILGFNMGVAGAACATILAQLVSGILCIVYIKKKLPLLWLTRDDFRIRRWEIAVHLKVGLPMAFQTSIIAIGSLILQFALNGLGAVSVAAYTAAQKIDMLATLPMSSFGTTMATYAAQNYGAQKYARIRKGVFQCAVISVSFAVAMGLVNTFAGYQLVEIFVGGGQKQVLSLAEVYLRVNGSMYFVLSLLFIFRFTLQGLGKGLVPTIAGIMELVMRAFAAVVLAGAFGFAGACWANPLAWLGACVPLAIAYIITHKKMPKQDLDVMSQNSCSRQTGYQTCSAAEQRGI